jgi:MFS family permease
MPDTVDRSPGNTQGWVLMATTWLAVAAAAVIAPVAPRMATHFAADPRAVTFVQVGIGLPALFVAILSGVFGGLAYWIGRRRLMLGALLLYAVCGVAPLWLDDLSLILVSRAGVGVAEAAVLATGTALVADYFRGAARDKWFAIQGGTATIAAAVFIGLSGALGETGWRLPFAVYVLPALVAAFVARYIWEPAREAGLPGRVAKTPAAGMVSVCVVTLATAIAFFIVLVQLPFLLVERGFGESWQVAVGGVAATITAPFGAVLFRRMAGRAVAARLTVSFALSAIGLAIVVFSPAYVPTLIGAAVNGVGSGMALPTLMAWAMTGRTPAIMGRIAGTWNSAYALGQFLSPPLFLAVAALAGSRAGGMTVFAVALGVAATVAGVLAMRQRSRSSLEVRYHT